MSEITNDSYRFSQRTDKTNELNRLHLQANVVQQVELQHLVNHGLKQNMRVLDAACGPGEMTRMLGQFLTEGEVIGIDVNEELLETARLKQKDATNISFAKENVYQISAEQEFDFIYCRLLLQHLDQPMEAICSLTKALRPGGIICILDIDDRWLSITPSMPAFEQLRSAYCTYQQSLGGDRHVGTKLPYYLRKLDYHNVQSSMILLSSDQIGWEPFVHLTTSFRVQPLMQEGKTHMEAAYQEVMEAGTKEDAFGILGTFIVSGMKREEA